MKRDALFNKEFLNITLILPSTFFNNTHTTSFLEKKGSVNTKRMLDSMKRLFLFVLITGLSTFSSQAQESRDTMVQTIDVDLLNIYNQKTPKKYRIAGIEITGNKYFDENLLLSITNLTVGEEVTIPGGDQFSKAIKKLWEQRYFSNVEIYITKLVGKDIYLEINVTERPRLSRFNFRGVKKGDQEDLSGKSGLVPNRVVTENMKITAMEAIKKFYYDKGFRNIRVDIKETPDSTFENSIILDFLIAKGSKIRIDNINFGNVEVSPTKLKKQLKETKEQMRLTLTPRYDTSGIIIPERYTFKQYMNEWGFLNPSKTKQVLDPMYV